MKQDKPVLDEYPDFTEAWSVRKLMSDINPECTCFGGYCYSRDKNNNVVKSCSVGGPILKTKLRAKPNQKRKKV